TDNKEEEALHIEVKEQHERGRKLSRLSAPRRKLWANPPRVTCPREIKKVRARRTAWRKRNTILFCGDTRCTAKPSSHLCSQKRQSAVPRSVAPIDQCHGVGSILRSKQSITKILIS